MDQSRPLPTFRYHPDPVATGAVITTDKECECCGQTRGWTISHPIYCQDEIDTICPWCVADGSAADKFDGSFIDDRPLIQAGLDAAIIEEVNKRTPGYISWQQDNWIACCNDACEFHGDASRESLMALDQDGVIKLSEATDFPFDVLMDVLKDYEPGGNPAFYRFVCGHCKAVHHNADFH